MSIIGLSKNYHKGELKRVLGPAIAELEKQGFLKPMTGEDRFLRKAKGEWNAVFIREGKAISQASAVVEEEPELVSALTKRGVNLSSARTLVSGTEEGKIRERIALFDWLVAKNDPRVQRSPAGFLYSSIKECFELPEDYVAAVRPKPTTKVRKLVPLQRHTTSRKPAPDRSGIDEFWNAMSPEEQERIEKNLVSNAPKFLREQYVSGRKEGGLLFQTVRQSMIDSYVRSLQGAAPSSNARHQAGGETR